MSAAVQSLVGARAAVPSTAMQRLRRAVANALVIAKRNLLHVPRNPELLLDVTIQPVIFVLLFRYVFGGAIAIHGTSYVNFLIPGMLAQTALFGGLGTAQALAQDMQRGIIDRFRSLPMAPSAVLVGRSFTDLALNAFGLLVALALGIAVGFRPQGSPWHWLAAAGLMVLATFVSTWLLTPVGLLLRSPEAVQAAGFILFFPLSFISSAFVPTQTMPSWLRVFADHQPVTLWINTLRGLLLDQPVGGQAWQALAWLVGIFVVVLPISVALYQRRTAS